MAKSIKFKRYTGSQWEEIIFPYEHNHTWSQITSPTTLEGYGITDCSIVNGTITIGNKTIVPITSLSGYATQTWVENQKYALASTVNTIAACFNTNGEAKEAVADAAGNVITTTYATKSEIPKSLPASDVYSWAKASTKPSYSWSEIGSKPTWIGTSKPTYTASEVGATTEEYVDGLIDYVIDEELPKYVLKSLVDSGETYNSTTQNNIPTKGSVATYANATYAPKSHKHASSDITGLANVATSGKYSDLSGTPTIPTTLPASDVYAWAKAATKPTYTAEEVGAAPSSLSDTVSAISSSVSTIGKNVTTIQGYFSSGVAKKATADASGNNIASTYETKANAITGLSVSGKVITYTKGDSTTGTITTQDTNTTYSAGTGISLSNNTFSNSGVRSITQDSSNGRKLTINTGGTSTTITIPDSDTKYTLPNATSSTLGGVKIGDNISVSSGTISLTKSNVTNALGYTPPTTNTTYSAATTSAAGLMSATDKAKLDGIAASANNYSLPTAGSTLGGVKTTSTVTSTSGLTACPIISGVPYYKDTDTTSFLPLSGGTVTGTITMTGGDMITRYTAVKEAGHETTSTYGKIVTLSTSGYIRYRTPAEILSDIGGASSSDLTSLSTTVGNLSADVTSMTNSISNLNTTVNNLAASVTVKTTTTVYSTAVQVTSPSQGAVTTKSITLTSSVQAGDRLKVYIFGGTGAPQLQTGIIEFELFNPSSNSLAGTGSFMSATGAQTVIISAAVSKINATTTTDLKVSVWGLSTNASSSNSQVWIQKVERVR